MDAINEFNNEAVKIAKVVISNDMFDDDNYKLIIKQLNKILKRKELNKKNKLAFVKIRDIYNNLHNEMIKGRTKLFEIIYSMKLN